MRYEESIRKLGFKRWYERQLIESHGYLVTCFLSMILIAVALDDVTAKAPALERLLMIALAGCAFALSIYAWGKYLRRSHPGRARGAGRYMRAVPSLCRLQGRWLRATTHATAASFGAASGRPAGSVAARTLPEMRTRVDGGRRVSALKLLRGTANASPALQCAGTSATRGPGIPHRSRPPRSATGTVT